MPSPSISDLAIPTWQETARTVGRRDILRAAGVLGIGALVGRRAAALAHAPATALPTAAFGVCNATASGLQGPFYADLDLVRKDITEGVPGIRIAPLIVEVLNTNCDPIVGAEVDIWQCDALGSYSGFASRGTAGQTFLRGIQSTAADGQACFETIYPGWYPGRTPHIHVKVRPTPQTELTTQLYFQDSISSALFQLPPYDANGPNPVNNTVDQFFVPNFIRLFRVPGSNPIELMGGITIVVN